MQSHLLRKLSLVLASCFGLFLGTPGAEVHAQEADCDRDKHCPPCRSAEHAGRNLSAASYYVVDMHNAHTGSLMR